MDKRTKEFRQQNKQVVLVCLNCGRRWVGIDRPINLCKYSCQGINVPTEIVVDNTLRTIGNDTINK